MPSQIFEKAQPLDMDELNYDFNDDEENSRDSNMANQVKVKETNHQGEKFRKRQTERERAEKEGWREN